MVGRRVALLVATDSYQDSGLSRLAAPSGDARTLAAVLGDASIAGFEVTQLYNRPNAEVGRAIGDFYRNRKRDDLTLLYFTGHGIKDDYGQLYLAMTDTDRDNLPFTGVRGEQIRLAMEGCRSRQNVLILDCCYAGAFPAGSGVKGDTAVHALEQLGGRGSVVLTSSDATQYSFEGSQLIETGPSSGPSSLFTRFLVEGLKTGQADLDGDGNITLDELYSYVHDHVTEERPQQRPKKKEDVEGRILIAWNIHWTLPPHISSALSSPYAVAKLTALEELRSRYNRGNTIVQQRVLETVRELVKDDSKQVSNAASQFLSAVIEAGEQARREAGEQARREAGEQARREAGEQARREAEEEAEQKARRDVIRKGVEADSQVDQSPPSTPASGPGLDEGAPQPRGLHLVGRGVRRRLVLVATGAAAAVIGLITAVVLVSGRPHASGAPHASGSPRAAPASSAAPPAVIFRDDFSSRANGWTAVAGDGGYSNGTYYLSTPTSSLVALAIPRNAGKVSPSAPQNISIDVTARSLADPGQNDYYGIACRQGPWGAYLFLVGDQVVYAEKWTGDFNTGHDNPNVNFNGSAKATNQLRAVCANEGPRSVHLMFWVNGQKVADWTDSQNPFLKGTVGLADSSTSTTKPTRAEFDNFVVRKA